MLAKSNAASLSFKNLESFVTAKVWSCFLNEVDGIDSNGGVGLVVTIGARGKYDGTDDIGWTFIPIV